MKDKNGNTIIFGNPYLYIFGGPGPDVTLLVAKELKNEKVMCYDLYFCRDIEVYAKDMFQREKTKWSDQEIKLVMDYGANFEFMLIHNKGL